MTISPLLRTLAAAASLLLSAPAWSAGEEPPPPPAASQSAVAAVAETRTLIEEGRFKEALGILRPLAQGGAVEANVLFLIGLAATGASQQPDLSGDEREALLDEAIASLRAMLVDRPDLVRVRLELARAFFLKGENDLSRKHFEHVLAGSPPGAVAAKVRRFLSEIRARRRWSLRAGFALAPDTNIGGTSAERIIYINNLPFTRDQAELTTSGIGVSVWGGWEYQYPLGERLRLRIRADASRREYAGRRFDQMFVSGHAGPRWLVGANTEASVLASAHRRWSANVPDYDALGGRIEAGHRFTRRVTASARASWHDRRYRTRMFLDGPVMAASLSGAWVVTPTVRADARWAGGASSRRGRDGAMPAAGCDWAPRLSCRGASPWAAAASCAGRSTRAGGSRSRPAASPGRTGPVPYGSPCTTGPSRGRASARNSRWCTRCGRPMHSSTTTSAPAANCASCAFSDATGRSRASIFLVVMLATAPDCMRKR